jgi:hypothetical protein
MHVLPVKYVLVGLVPMHLNVKTVTGVRALATGAITVLVKHHVIGITATRKRLWYGRLHRRRANQVDTDWGTGAMTRAASAAARLYYDTGLLVVEKHITGITVIATKKMGSTLFF